MTLSGVSTQSKALKSLKLAMNYAKTSMNYLNLLPPRMRQMVYDFDGRYKAAKDQCIEIIRQRGQTPIGLVGSAPMAEVYLLINCFPMKTLHRDYPEYYAEVERRVSMYRSRMENGHIRGVTTHMKRAPKSSYSFKDAMGSYKFGQVFETKIIDGIAYKSTERVHSVAIEKLAYKGTPTVVKCIDVLDPAFKKTIKGRQPQKIHTYRELGVSENGIPAAIFKKVLEGRFGRTGWFWERMDQKNYPPASLAAVTALLERAKTDRGRMCDGGFNLDGGDYKICIKTGTGIIYRGKEAVGYVTKNLMLRLAA